MSIRVMTSVWDKSALTGPELLLMLAIADFANEDGEAYPGVERLAHKCRVKKRAIQRTIKRCVKSGELTIFYNQGTKTISGNTNLYKINLQNLGRGVQDDTPCNEGVAQTTPHGVAQTTPHGVAQTTPKPSVKPPAKPSVLHEEKFTPHQLIFGYLAKICKIDLNLITNKQKDKLGQVSDKLIKADIKPPEIELFGQWWYSNDWRGIRGQSPTPWQVVETWGQYKTGKNGSKRNGGQSNGQQKDKQPAWVKKYADCLG